MVDLNALVDMPPGWILADATAINDAGQIVANGWSLDQNIQHAFLLTPVPSTLALGILGMLAFSRRRPWRVGGD